MNVCESLTVTAKTFPERIAIVYEDRPLTYGELDRRSAIAAQYLSMQGIRRGDRVALMLPNAPSFPVWYYAALRIGAIAVSVSTRLTASEVIFVIEDCSASAFVAIDPISSELSGNLPECVSVVVGTSIEAVADGEMWSESGDGCPAGWIKTERDDAAVILYTSGTTGFAKGATLSHGNVRSNVFAFNHLCNMQPDDRILLAVPLFHCFGQNALLNSALNVGATLILQPNFDLNESKRLIAKHHVTQLYGVPMMFQLLEESLEQADLASVNYCFSAAATLPLQISHAWHSKFGQPIYEGYGLTETSPFASYNHRTRYVAGSIGTPIDMVEMKIVNPETGEDCQTDELGEIAIRGPNVMLGYWNRPEDTASAIRNGWFHSGDIGRRDEKGVYYIVDRVKDMITVGGLKVFPAEVERVLLDCPAVNEVAVVGIPDPIFGEQVIAFVQRDSDHNSESVLAEIQDYARRHLGNYKLPRRIELIETLPRNASGKVLKTKLRELVSIEEKKGDELSQIDISSSLRPASLRRMLQQTHASDQLRVATEFVQQLVQDIGRGDELPPVSVGFLDLGLDSLMLVELSTQLQVELGKELPATLVFDYPRIADLGQFLHEQCMSSPVVEVVPGVDLKTQVRAGEPQMQSVLEMSEAEALEALLAELED
ncbi:MAG: AMP-binding protein [Planctomycetota bacterium]|nr:AMP-binding protein [Planctomycetota bacterium]